MWWKKQQFRHKTSSMVSPVVALADVLDVLCATFYKKKSHDGMINSAERLLEEVAASNISDIGESDEDKVGQERLDSQYYALKDDENKLPAR